MYLGEVQNFAVRLCHVGDSRILEVISDTEYPRLVRGEERSLLIKVNPGNPVALTIVPPTPRREIQPTIDPSSSNKSTQSKQTSEYMKPPGIALSISRTAAAHRYNEQSRCHCSRTLQTKPFAPCQNLPRPAVAHGEYVYRIGSQKIASMYSNPDRALSEIKCIRASVRRVEGKADLQDIPRARMVKRFSQTTAASASDGLVDSARRRLSFASDATDEVLAY